MWRGEVRRGRAGQAFDFGEPGVLDGATAMSLAAGRHWSRQVGQIVKMKPIRRSCLRILDQSLEPREPAKGRPPEHPQRSTRRQGTLAKAHGLTTGT
jgi:hypothetical protein